MKSKGQKLESCILDHGKNFAQNIWMAHRHASHGMESTHGDWSLYVVANENHILNGPCIA